MSGRKPALPGVQKDVDTLLSADPVAPTTVAAAPVAEPAVDMSAQAAMRATGEAANDGAPATVSAIDLAGADVPRSKPMNGAHGGAPRDIDRAALMELASQFPSAGTPVRPPEPAGPAVAVAALETPIVVSAAQPAPSAAPSADPIAEAVREPVSDAASRGVAGRVVGSLDSALFGNDPMRRWAVMAGIAIVGLVLVVLLEAAFLSAPTNRTAETPGAPGVVADDGRDALRARLTETQGRLDALEAATRETARGVVALREQVGPLLGAAGGDAGAIRLALFTMRLETLAGAGRPFAGELVGAKASAGANPDLAAALARLDPFAEAGAPTRRDLAMRVSAQAPRIAAMSGDAGSGGILDSVGGIFSRKPSAETVTAAILARAQAELEVGDLGAAVRQLQRLPGAQRQAALPWIAAAERRVALDAAIGEVTTIAFRGMAKAP